MLSVLSGWFTFGFTIMGMWLGCCVHAHSHPSIHKHLLCSALAGGRGHARGDDPRDSPCLPHGGRSWVPT